MGYYTTQAGTVRINVRDEAAAVEALKGLNHNHEDKHGRSWPACDKPDADPYETRWYSWMPSKFHEDDSMTTVGHVLEMLGYEVTSRYDGDLLVYSVSYDNKTGQEDVFLNRLADFATVNIEVTGEDGDKWKWENTAPGHSLLIRSGVVTYDSGTPVAASIANVNSIMRQTV